MIKFGGGNSDVSYNYIFESTPNARSVGSEYSVKDLRHHMSK